MIQTAGMWWRWQQSPWWVLGLIQGIFFAVVFAAGSAAVGGESLTSTLPGALVSGVLFGALMGPMSARMRKRLLADVPTHATAEQRRAGAHAARRGPVPTDPTTRQVAVHLTQQRLEMARRGRLGQLLLFAALTAVYVALTLSSSRWWLLGAAFFVFLFVLVWVQPRRLQQRLDQLTADLRVCDPSIELSAAQPIRSSRSARGAHGHPAKRDGR
jgi:hypothetical protein